MARRRNMNRSSRSVKQVPESDAMAALRERTSEIDRRDAYDKAKSGFQPKPRAIRKYEKYANMGG